VPTFIARWFLISLPNKTLQSKTQSCFTWGVTITSFVVGTLKSLKNSGSHIDASHSRQPLVKGERLVRYEVNAVMSQHAKNLKSLCSLLSLRCFMSQKNDHAKLTNILNITISHRSLMDARNVTPKGVQPPALRHASAPREGPWASSRGHLPRYKLMRQASLQLETYQLSHWWEQILHLIIAKRPRRYEQIHRSSTLGYSRNLMRCLSVNMLLQKKQKNIACAHYQSLFKVSVGSSSQADYLMRNAAMDDSIGGS
jgi:hypothetical protein